MKFARVLRIVCILFIPLSIILYFCNVVQFFRCDLKAPWECEIIHGVGVAGVPTFYVTAWKNYETKKESK